MCAFVILANGPPSLNDSSGALLRRYIVIQMPFSFVGKEDPDLETKLLDERSGILKWMIEGRRMLPIEVQDAEPAVPRSWRASTASARR